MVYLLFLLVSVTYPLPSLPPKSLGTPLDPHAHYFFYSIFRYYEKLISDVSKDVDEVELLRDGTWRVVQQECEMLSDSDNEVSTVNVKTEPKVQPSAPTAQQQPKKDQTNVLDVITLSDSEDEAPSASTPARPPQTGSATSATKNVTPSRAPVESNSSDDSIIVLDDDGPSPPQTAPPSVSTNASYRNNGTPPVSGPATVSSRTGQF